MAAVKLKPCELQPLQWRYRAVTVVGHAGDRTTQGRTVTFPGAISTGLIAQSLSR